jgi:hypothetical protein
MRRTQGLQAVPVRGLLQVSRSSSRQHALHAMSAAGHTAAARRHGGAVTPRSRPGANARRPGGDPADLTSAGQGAAALTSWARVSNRLANEDVLSAAVVRQPVHERRDGVANPPCAHAHVAAAGAAHGHLGHALVPALHLRSTPTPLASGVRVVAGGSVARSGHVQWMLVANRTMIRRCKSCES